MTVAFDACASSGTIIWVTIDATTLTCAYMLAAWPNYIASPIVESEALVLRTTMLILMSMGAFED